MLNLPNLDMIQISMIKTLVKLHRWSAVPPKTFSKNSFDYQPNLKIFLFISYCETSKSTFELLVPGNQTQINHALKLYFINQSFYQFILGRVLWFHLIFFVFLHLNNRSKTGITSLTKQDQKQINASIILIVGLLSRYKFQYRLWFDIYCSFKKYIS